MYPWECIDCDEYYIDLVKDDQFYCTKMRRYVKTNEPSCNTYFKKRDKNRPLQSNRSNCYITTAVVNILGYEDNCQTLEDLRHFRDNYMKKHEEYLPLLEEYDIVGPLISEKLEKDQNKEKIAKFILDIFIQEALDAIKDKEYKAAINTYENMTYFLMDIYELDMNLLNRRPETTSKVKQRKREINY